MINLYMALLLCAIYPTITYYNHLKIVVIHSYFSFINPKIVVRFNSLQYSQDGVVKHIELDPLDPTNKWCPARPGDGIYLYVVDDQLQIGWDHLDVGRQAKIRVMYNGEIPRSTKLNFSLTPVWESDDIDKNSVVLDFQWEEHYNRPKFDAKWLKKIISYILLFGFVTTSSASDNYRLTERGCTYYTHMVKTVASKVYIGLDPIVSDGVNEKDSNQVEALKRIKANTPKIKILASDGRTPNEIVEILTTECYK